MDKKNEREEVVMFAGRGFAVRPLPMGKAREWRKKYAAPIQMILGIIKNVGLDNLQDEQGQFDVVKIGGLVLEVGDLILGGIDLLNDAVFEYMRLSEADAQWILDNADDLEAMAAFWQVIKLAYPFGDLVAGWGNGPSTNGILKS